MPNCSFKFSICSPIALFFSLAVSLIVSLSIFNASILACISSMGSPVMFSDRSAILFSNPVISASRSPRNNSLCSPVSVSTVSPKDTKSSRNASISLCIASAASFCVPVRFSSLLSNSAFISSFMAVKSPPKEDILSLRSATNDDCVSFKSPNDLSCASFTFACDSASSCFAVSILACKSSNNFCLSSRSDCLSVIPCASRAFCLSSTSALIVAS